MPIDPIPYTPRPYVRSATLGQLLGLSGRNQADAIRQQGEIAAQRWATLGNQIGQGLQQWREAPLRKQAAEDARLAREDEQLARADRAAAREARKAQTVRAAALGQYVTTDPSPNLQGFVRIAGPVEGPKLFKDWFEGQQAPIKAETEAADRIAKIDKEKRDFLVTTSRDAAGDMDRAADNYRQDRQLTETERNNKEQNRLAARAASRAGSQDTEWVMRGGEALQIPKGTAQRGDTPYRAPQSTSETAQDRQRKGRLNSARDFLTRLNELREKINTKVGPQAGLTGLARQGAAAIGLDPDVAEYERVKAAGGRALAVAIMGAQNLSDADAAAWSDMLPGARVDAVTAKRLTDQVGKMLDETEGADVTPKPKVVAVPSLAGLKPGVGRKFRDGPFAGQTWAVDEAGTPYQVN